MKKIIMLVVFAAFTISGFAKEVEVSLPDTTKVTFTQVYNDVKDGITGLATALKEPAEHIYKLMVKQQFVNSITYCMFPLLSIVFIIVSVPFLKKSKWGYSWVIEEKRFNRYAALSIITISLSIVLLIISFALTDDIITGFMNPEYGAIKEIITFVK
jgi:hypothetical protein